MIYYDACKCLTLFNVALYEILISPLKIRKKLIQDYSFKLKYFLKSQSKQGGFGADVLATHCFASKHL